MLSTHAIRLIHSLRYKPERRSVSEDVTYSIGLTQKHLSIAAEFGIDVSRASILEIGPGLSFAPQLALAGYGARVAVADRFLSKWHPGYHPRFYKAFRAQWHGPSAALDKVIAAGGYPPAVITCTDEPAEKLYELRGQHFNFVISNAVLEHVSDMNAVARTLAALTRPGGANTHQVDFGDHLDRTRPLEFLLYSDARFSLEKLRHPSQGNRIRQSECVAIFEQAGFSIEKLEPNSFTEDSYLHDFVPRLRRSRSRYRNWPADDLRVLGARLYLRRL